MKYNKAKVDAAIEAMRELNENERHMVAFTLEREKGRRKRKSKDEAAQPKLEAAES